MAATAPASCASCSSVPDAGGAARLNLEAERDELGLNTRDHALQLIGRIRGVYDENALGSRVSSDRGENDASGRAARTPGHGESTLRASFACGPLGYVSR